MKRFALLSLVACGPKLGAPDVSYGEVEPLPMVQTSTDHNRWYVVVDTGTHGERLFFLDSGYARTTCDDDFVHELGLRPRGWIFVHGVGGSLIAKKARLPELSAGGHELSKFSCIVRDMHTTSSIKDPLEVDVAGVIGADLLSRFVTVIDPVTATVRLIPPDDTQPLPTSPEVVRLRRRGVGGTRFMVQATVNRRGRWWLLDTGARGSHLDGSRYGIEPTSVREGAFIQGTGNGGGQTTDLHFFDDAAVVLAGQTIGELRLVDRTHGIFGFDLLGLNVLGAFRITLDPGRRAARFELIEGQRIEQWSTWKTPTP